MPISSSTVVVGSGSLLAPVINGFAGTADTLWVGAAGAGQSLSVMGGGSMAVSSASIGESAGDTGAVFISGSGTSWGRGSHTNSFLDLGRLGTGSLSVSGGANVSVTSATLGTFNGGSGTLTLSGAGTSFYTRSAHIIGAGGQGRVEILSGAKSDDPGVTFGQQSTGRGTGLVSGANSLWNIRNALTVGNAGSGELNVTDGGRVSVTSNVRIGDASGSRGTMLVGSGATVETQQITVLGWNAGSQGSLRITGAGSKWLGTNYLMVGNLGQAEATIDSGGSLRIRNGLSLLSIANGTGSTGTVNIGAAEGATARAPGYMDVSEIRFGLGSGRLVFNHTDAAYAVDARITGKGILLNENGTTILRGSNSFTGSAEVRGGTLIVDGSLGAASGLLVGAAGTVGGSGTLPTTTVNGTLAPGNSPGTLTVNGNLTLNPGAVYIAEVQGAHADRVNVTGTASLAGALQVKPLGGTYTFNTPYTLLSAQTGRTGMFDTVATSFGPAIQANVSYTGTDVLLTLSPVSLAAFAGMTRNGLAVATAIDRAALAGGDMSPLFSIYSLSGQALPVAVNQLSGEAHTGVPAMAVSAAGQFLGLMLDPRTEGRLFDTAGAAGPTAPRQAAAVSGQLSAVQQPRYSIWGATFGSFSRTEGNGTIGSSRREIDDAHVAVGADIRVTPDMVVGFAVAGGKARAMLPAGLGRAEADAFQAGLYGFTRLGPVDLGAAFGFARLGNSINRNVPALGSTLTASYATTAWSGRFQAGTALATWNGLTLSPLTAIQVIQVHSPAVSETNAAGGFGGALTLGSRTDMTARIELGAELKGFTRLGDIPVSATIRAAWANYLRRDADLQASMIGLPDSAFVITGARLAPNTALLSAGIDAKLTQRLSLGLRLDGELAGNGNRIGGSARFRMSF